MPFFFVGGILYAIKLNIEMEKLYYLIEVVVCRTLIQLQIIHKKRESEAPLYKRYYCS
jgi:hypothetical protein